MIKNLLSKTIGGRGDGKRLLSLMKSDISYSMKELERLEEAGLNDHKEPSHSQPFVPTWQHQAALPLPGSTVTGNERARERKNRKCPVHHATSHDHPLFVLGADPAA